MAIDTIVFDFDGTIMNTNQVVIESWQHTYKTILGREGSVEDIIRTFGEPLDITMRKVFPEVPVEESIRIYRSYHKDNFGKKITVFPGMRELLAELKKRGYKTALLTSRLKNTTLEGLEKYELLHLLDQVVTCDDVKEHKPSPVPMYVVLEKLGSVPERSVLVGDTLFDLYCAKNAGARSVLVGWQQALSEEDLEGDGQPDFYIEKASDLLDVLYKENGKISLNEGS